MLLFNIIIYDYIVPGTGQLSLRKTMSSNAKSPRSSGPLCAIILIVTNWPVRLTWKKKEEKMIKTFVNKYWSAITDINNKLSKTIVKKKRTNNWISLSINKYGISCVCKLCMCNVLMLLVEHSRQLPWYLLFLCQWLKFI